MPTIQQLAAQLNREAAASLQSNALAIPADKVTWKPLEMGRSVLSQIVECALITGYAANILSALKMQDHDEASHAQAKAELDTIEKALAALQANTDKLVAVIEAFPTEELDNTLQLPWLPEPQSFAKLLLMSYWNNVYHIGQIAYIQTLYGDKEMH